MVRRSDPASEKLTSCFGKKYTANFYFDADGRLLDTEVCEGDVVGSSDSGIVLFRGIIRGIEQTVEIPEHLVLENRLDAERKINAALAWKERRILSEAVKGNVNFLPQPLAILEKSHMSGNPLRAGERMILFSAQSNAWGAQDNEQKVLQLAGAIWEDIEMLKGILFVLGYANDYAKKLVGKYIIIELSSLYRCLRRLSELDASYKNGLFTTLTDEIKELEIEYQFKAIRDKIAAHRDTNIDLVRSVGFWKNITRHSIIKHIDVFSYHLAELKNSYPFEITSYFMARHHPIHGALGATENSDEYRSFDDPFLSEKGTDNIS